MDVIGFQSCSRPFGGISESGAAGWPSMLQGMEFDKLNFWMVRLEVVLIRHSGTPGTPSR
jgi:hypothetical protein